MRLAVDVPDTITSGAERSDSQDNSLGCKTFLVYRLGRPSVCQPTLISSSSFLYRGAGTVLSPRRGACRAWHSQT